MTTITEFLPDLAHHLAVTHALLKSANLTIHPSVSRIVLHGSRGPAGGFRQNSDLDLSLIVEIPPQIESAGIEPLLQVVFETTYSAWKAAVEPDIAIVFDQCGCELKCFDLREWQEDLCCEGGIDCFGLYKTQKGFHGLVTNSGVKVKMMYPCMQIWQRSSFTRLSPV